MWASPRLCFTPSQALPIRLDGYLARKWEQSKPFGAYPGSRCRQLMVARGPGNAGSEPRPIFWVTAPAMVSLVVRSLFPRCGEWMAELGKRAHVAVLAAWQYTDRPPQNGRADRQLLGQPSPLIQPTGSSLGYVGY